MNVNNREQPQLLNMKIKDSMAKVAPVPIVPLKKQTFISKVQRFGSPLTMTPGPGTYQSLALQKHTLDFRKEGKKEENIWELPRQHAWINGSGRMSYVPSNSALNRVGPGQYGQISNQFEQKNSSWSKCQRFNQLKGFENRLGPGSYNSKINPNKTASPVSMFKSKSPRTFIQQMVQKSSKEFKARKNPEVQQNNNKEQVIKFEQTEYLVRKKSINNSSVFLSKSERPDNFITQYTSKMIGPGTYSNQNSKSKGFLEKLTAPRSSIHYSGGSTEGDSKEYSKASQLGPGCYRIEAALNSQRLVKKKEPLGIIPRSQRFQKSLQPKVNLSLSKKSNPGPGQYMQKRFTLINQEDVRFRSKGSFARKPQKNHNFGIAPRQTNRNHSENPFGEYNVKNYDIENKLLKQKQQYQKLRMMEVTLPAFNTKRRHQ